MKKFNPYIIVIVILLIVVSILLYKQWSGKKIGDININISNDDIQIGRDDAPVVIIEYYSYLCGYCKQFEDAVKPKIIENYITTGKARLILRSFPPYELSQAVLCANDQEKFLEYHNYLFANNDKIKSIEDLKSFAKTIGLNESEFNQCLDSGKYKSKAEEWYAQGNSDFTKAGIPQDKQGTPAFFINGEPVIGAVPYEDFVKIIESKLK
jgi:protein-disulfide isomerase